MTATTLTPSAALEELRRRGHRITVAREAIVTLVLGSHEPVTAGDVQARLSKKGKETNKVTVYRELAFLEKEGIVGAVQFEDGVRRYTSQDGGHRHHLICTQCKTVSHVELPHDLDAVERRISKTTDFTIERHELEFYGRCGKCS